MQSDYENSKYWITKVLLYSFTLVLAIFVSRLIWRWRNFISLVNKLPMLKVRTYHVLGHAQYNLYRRLERKPLSPRVYDFIGMIGYSYVLRDQSLAGFWASFLLMIQIHKADAIETILNNSTELEKAWPYRFLNPWLGNGLLISHGSQWKNRRKILTPAFHFNILKDFVPAINKQSKILVDLLNNQVTEEFTEIKPFITKCSFDIICETVLGVDMKSQTNPSCPYLTSVNILTSIVFERMMNVFLWPDFIFKRSAIGKKFFENVKFAQDVTNQIINERKERRLQSNSAESSEQKKAGAESSDEHSVRRKRALLDLMLDEHLKDNSFSESDIREEVDTFTFEGHDTTSMALCWALYLIGLHPGIQEKIHEELDAIFGSSVRDVTDDDLKEMKYLECVLKESLRLYPSVPYFGRQLREDVEFQGLVVPKGTTCMIFPYSLHRDPDVFPVPEKFDPERFLPENSIGRNPFAYIPFSAGPRNCIGQRFALLEEKIVIATVMRKFKLRSLDPRDKIHVVNELVLRPVEPLRIEIRPRNYKPEKPPVFFYYP